MTFLDILKNTITDLPINQSHGSFISTLKQRFDDFGELINQSNDLSEPVHNSEFMADLFKQRNEILRSGILKCLQAYYQGKPSEAYEILKKFMDDAGIRGYLDKDSSFPVGSNFFRIRNYQGNFPLTKNDLFHIPFELRGKVKTQRYSIPGLPSLYLSNSIYVAWEEMRRPGFDKIQAVRLSNIDDLKVLDLTTDVYVKNEHLNNNEDYGWQLLYKVMIWPLVAACSVKVKNFDDEFKPEYIIPQLLLQWINKNELDGIKYSSTHIDLKNNKHEGQFFNVVLPVKTFDKEEGYCSVLTKKFKSSQVLPMQLTQFMSATGSAYNIPSITSAVNKDIVELELIKGSNQLYMMTSFGKLEHNLNHLMLEDIC